MPLASCSFLLYTPQTSCEQDEALHKPDLMVLGIIAKLVPSTSDGLGAFLVDAR